MLLWHFCVSGAGYKTADLLTYLLWKIPRFVPHLVLHTWHYGSDPLLIDETPLQSQSQWISQSLQDLKIQLWHDDFIAGE